MAHGGVIVCVSSKHQHGSTHYHSRVQVAKKSTVFKNSPSEIKIYVLMKLISTWQRQNNTEIQAEGGFRVQGGVGG